MQPAAAESGGGGPPVTRAKGQPSLGPQGRREELPVAGPQGRREELPVAGSQGRREELPVAGSQGEGGTTPSSCLGNREAAGFLATQNNDQQGIPSVAPVVYVGKRHVRREYLPFSYQDKKELCKMQKQFGRSSEIFKGMMKATFNSNEMVPSDNKDLFRCLLTPSEYDLWEGLWKKALKTVLQEIQQTPDAQDSDDNDITHDHLCGEGDLSSANEQIRLLSKSVLDKICNAAEKTFYQIPSPEIKTSYVNIKQFPSENFLQFVDRLRSQVERQLQDPVVQAELIKEMAQRNANETCRRIILSLPLDPSPSLAQMIEACTTRAELFSVPERNPGLTHPKPVAAAAPGPRRQPMSSDQLQHIICHRCKRPGHFAKACPENQKPKSKNQKN
ncbi:hypothetical protein DUI87_02668 [Hirundo rustica rustica]|uniref:CCHC-type domain-containing protein n=1 Tax=Hirundo rustica rustica TaxID=333673 RepID=A0A3M0L8D9_HIRRU|nr:hypothetical protein DUI87_02668 [Hirundo rustica rustica]